MQITTTTTGPGRTARVAVTGGAVLLIGASAALGTAYGYQIGAHYHPLIGVVFAGAALGGELLKPFAVQAAIANWWRPLRLAACVCVAAVCIAYSLVSELGFAAMSRGDLAAERQKLADDATDAADKKKRARDELAALKAPKRSAQELEAEIRRTPVAKGRCAAENGTGRWVCETPAHRLTGELARAHRYEQLSVTVNGTSNGTFLEADPLAASLATYAAAAGWTVDAGEVSRWLNLLPVLFLEIGSAFGLVVSATVRQRTVSTVGSGRTDRTEPTEPGQPKGSVRRRRQMSKLEAERFVVSELAFGRALPSQDALARKAGVAKSTAHEWVREWERRKLITRARVGKCNVLEAA